jgi:hypothetical protein
VYSPLEDRDTAIASEALELVGIFKARIRLIGDAFRSYRFVGLGGMLLVCTGRPRRIKWKGLKSVTVSRRIGSRDFR